MARVLITGFCAVPGPSRAGVQLRHVVRALSPVHAVDLLVVREGEQAYVERAGQVRILRVPTHDHAPRGQIQAFQRALRRQLDGADYDVVHCRDGWSGVTVLEAKPRLGFAVVYDLTRGPLDGAPAADAELEAERQRDEEACLLAADLVLVPTEAARRYAAARGKPDRVVLSPPGVDVDRFDWEAAPAKGPPRVLYVGALEPGRGVRVLLRAMVEVARHGDARLVLAGPIAPGFEPVLRAGIDELGLASRVELRGPVDHDDVPALIASATACVAPAASELTPRPLALYPTKILEYLACRRAVVAARRGTVAMLIDHGREGLLFAPGDAADLARKLVRVLEDQPLRERLAAAGYERVRKEFTASAARRAVRAAYAQTSERPHLRARFAPGGAHDGAGRGSDSGAPVADDDFEATVFEEGAPPGEVSLEAQLSSLDVALAGDDDPSRPDAPVTEERAAAPPGDETAVRPARAGSEGWGDDWVVAPIQEASHPPDWDPATARGDGEDEGTPLDVVPAPPLPLEPPSFVSGEIDVPTPTPELAELRDLREREREPDGGFTAASNLLGGRGGPRTGDTGP